MNVVYVTECIAKELRTKKNREIRNAIDATNDLIQIPITRVLIGFRSLIDHRMKSVETLKLPIAK